MLKMRKKRNEKFYLLIGALVLVLALTACGGGGSKNDPTPTTGNISGKIFKSDGTTPIANAKITVEGSTITDTSKADGSYTLAGVPRGDNKKVTAISTSYYTNSVTVNVQAGQTASNQNIKLTSTETPEKQDTFKLSGTISF